MTNEGAGSESTGEVILGACSVCGRPLLVDRGELSDGPLCEECYEAREFDETLWELDES